VLLATNDSKPIAVLPEPELVKRNADAPVAVLFSASLNCNALVPVAVFELPENIIRKRIDPNTGV